MGPSEKKALPLKGRQSFLGLKAKALKPSEFLGEL